MLIKKINVSNFGKLSDITVTPADGLNLIYAPNEGGKTTLLSFVKYIFYGTKQKKDYKDLTFKERFMPWNSMVMSGSCEIEYCSDNFVVQRSESNNQSNLVVIRESTANEEKHITNPGKEFFGVNEKAFTDSFFIKELAKFSDLTDEGEIISTLTDSYNEKNTYNKVKSELNEELSQICSSKRKTSKTEIINTKISEYEEMIRVNNDKISKINEKIALIDECKKEQEIITNEIKHLEKKRKNDTITNIKNKIENLKDEQYSLKSEYFESTTDSNLSEEDKKILIDDFVEITDSISKTNKAIYKNILTGSLFLTLTVLLSCLTVYKSILCVIPAFLCFTSSFILFFRVKKLSKTVKSLQYNLCGLKNRQSLLMSELKLRNRAECLLYISALKSESTKITNKYLNQRLEQINHEILRLQTILDSDDGLDKISASDTIFFTNLKLNDIIIQKEKKLSELNNNIIVLSHYNDELIALEDDNQNIYSEIRRLNEEKNLLLNEAEIIERSLDILEKSFLNVKKSFIPDLSKRTAENLRYIIGDEYNCITFDKDFNIFFKKDGFVRNSKYLSSGTFDALYFSLRLAIIEMITQKDTAFPIFIDDIFSNCDDIRAEKIMELIYNLSKKYQVFVCTCRKRDVDFLKAKHNVNIISMQKG